MAKMLFIRVIALISVILGCMFFSCNFEESNFGSVMILLGLFASFSFITYASLRNKTQEEVKRIFGLTWLENKTGINFTEE